MKFSECVTLDAVKEVYENSDDYGSLNDEDSKSSCSNESLNSAKSEGSLDSEEVFNGESEGEKSPQQKLRNMNSREFNEFFGDDSISS